jgi:hypothetical protein
MNVQGFLFHFPIPVLIFADHFPAAFKLTFHQRANLFPKNL